ncbi:ATP-binding protein [Oscillatoria sp. CS-180]|uniref:ATP-binding protein n=1 Tax=Oscillatoria sp. CS-180 TaxID=3021720 RepID=UPI00232EEB8A|nr:ATP-binding protein [Oscillatoria sp. CS-180]MDB9525069.1 ATP-binding protein [Oscillatoria sp. CS-180]
MTHRIEQHSTTLLKPIQISPRSFKRQLETVLNALVQLRIRATIFAKLPQGNSWLNDLKNYSQAVNPCPEIYLFKRPSSATQAEFKSVIIPNTHAMQGEYFLVVIAETVGLMVLGQREDVVSIEQPASSSEDSETESPESLPKVNYSISVQKPLLQRKVNEIQQLFQASLEEHAEQPDVEAAIANWETDMQIPDYCSPALLDAIFLQEGSFQDQLQQKARAYRRQAMTASSLSSQNEALLNTLRLKDDFLNTVGQELRTPLSTIKTALPLLSSPNLKPPQRQRYLDMIGRECERQINLINGVLELLQIERSLMTAKPEPVKLFDILPGIVSIYQPIAQEKGIRLAYTVPNTLPAVGCPENWVRQIVIHLLSNSIRYTDSGGEVWVTAQDEEEDALVVNVRDTGMGIPQNELSHIFEHFYRGRQTNPDEEGAGLGLSIVQQLLLYCGGDISVESQPDVGTHFRVKLPIYQGT